MRTGGLPMPDLIADYVRTAIDRTQGRSMVLTTGGVVASEHPLASQAGASVLARGGHAVDAAIAANAVMGVVAPMMNGIGGDLFAIVYDAGDRRRCTASTAAARRRRRSRSTTLRARGITRMPQIGHPRGHGARARWRRGRS